METKPIYTYAIIADNFDNNDLIENKNIAMKENVLEMSELDGFELGLLFRLSDTFEYRQFDADIVLVNFESGVYYHTGNGQVMNRVDKIDDIKMLVNDDGDILRNLE
jgi:hypothetical protein